MSNAFIFDVDGTLTASRQHIDRSFAVWFNIFCIKNNVYLVTGSDKPKTVEQIGITLYNRCKRVYNCAGSEVWEQDTLVYKNIIEDTPQLRSLYGDLYKQLDSSPYPIRGGVHIENRESMINFSIIGRHCNVEQRKEYVAYDTLYKEREKICDELRKDHGAYFQFQVAGEIGIDIMEIGKDKSQILKDFEEDYVVFFGDMVQEGGNDYPLRKAIENRGRGITIPVTGWKDTWEKLKNDYWIHS